MTLNEIKNTGLLEWYVIGTLNAQEVQLVEHALAKYPELKKELQHIETAFEMYCRSKAVEPKETTKVLTTAVLQFTNRLKHGEVANMPPELTAKATIADYQAWLNRADMIEPADNKNMHGNIIGSDNEKTILIKWMRKGMPTEVHKEFIESLLIVEGSCDIYFNEQLKQSLQVGDYFAIPTGVNHKIVVTSKKSCKVILQRKVLPV